MPVEASVENCNIGKANTEPVPNTELARGQTETNETQMQNITPRLWYEMI